jgi:hypothetical protein
MNSIVRRTAVVMAVAFALAAPAVQALADLGMSASAFASQGDSTLRAAGYAFSIWSLIYAGLVAYAIYQWLPRADDGRLLARLTVPSIVAIAGCGAWIVASAADARWLSVVIIVASAASLSMALARSRDVATPALSERLCVWWPLGLLAGWLTIASAINILTVLTAEGLIGPSAAPAAGVAGIAVVGAAAVAMLRVSKLVSFGLPIVWGLVAVFVAERTDRPAVAVFALGIALLIAVCAAWLAWSARSRPIR